MSGINVKPSFLILLVDDNPADVETAKRYLGDRSAHVDLEFGSAGTVDEALREIARKNFDLIVLDYQLPPRNAFDLIEALYKNDWNIPVVMVTGQGDEAIASRAIKYDRVVDYIPKSRLSADTLYSSVVNTLVNARLSDGGGSVGPTEIGPGSNY